MKNSMFLSVPYIFIIGGYCEVKKLIYYIILTIYQKIAVIEDRTSLKISFC
jgi:hypothetical protein